MTEIKATTIKVGMRTSSGVQSQSLAQSSRRVIAETVLLIDLLAIAIAAVVAKFIYIGAYLGESQDTSLYLTVGIFGGLVAAFVIRAMNLYKLEVLIQLRGQESRLLLGLGASLLVLLGAAYLLKISSTFSRGWMFTWFGLNAFLLIFIHFVVAIVLRRWKSFGLFVRNVAIYGSGDIARELIERLGQNVEDTHICGVFDDLRPGATSAVMVSGGLSDLIRIGQDTRFDEVLIALPMTEKDQISNIVTQLSILPTNILFCPDILAFQLRPVGIVRHDGVTLLEIVRKPMDNWAPILKAIEDRILASIGLVLISPVMLAVALAVKLDSRGPVFFRQNRHGFNHQVISVYKFRTMRVAENGARVTQATKNDPRVTRVGKFLRSTSLDELPQLFNVIRGDMSLVGPRPHAIAHNEHYSAILETYASRHKVKPGITGWAQVNGFRGETDTPDKMRRRVEFDLYYIENWSIWFDVRILVMTPIFGLIGKNAF